MDGERDVLGMWFQANEGAKFWMQVLTDLKQRGVQDILICCVDGLKGFPEAIEAIFPQTTVQTCIVHLIRHSLKYVPRRQYDAVVKDLKPIYTAIDADAALLALEAFEEKWGAAAAGDRPGVAIGLGARDPVHGLRARGPPGDLHHERDRGAQPAAAQGDQDQGPLPDRGRRPQADLPRDPKRRPAMDPNPRLDEGAARVQNPLRRPTARLTINHRLHRKTDTLTTDNRRGDARSDQLAFTCCRRASQYGCGVGAGPRRSQVRGLASAVVTDRCGQCRIRRRTSHAGR